MLSFLSELEGTKGRNLGASLKNKVYFLKHKLCENMTTEFSQEAESRIRLTNSRRRGTDLQEKKIAFTRLTGPAKRGSLYSFPSKLIQR